MNDFIQATQKDVVEEVQKLVEEKGIKEKVLQEAQQIAQKTANHLLDNNAPPPETYQGIDISNEDDLDEYLLVLEYLESIGFKFAPSVLRYESQHPEQMVNRKALCTKLGLRSYDRTPLLVQLIEERLNSFQDEEGE